MRSSRSLVTRTTTRSRLERHHNYSLWDLWDDVKDFAHGKYPRNEAATAIYHEWLRAKGHATDEVAIVGAVIVFDEPIWQ